jgi:PAS domain S-box-containing protein
MDLSEYILEPPRKDEEFTSYQGQHGNPDQATRSSILLVAPSSPHRVSSGLGQIEHECSVSSELDIAEAVRPYDRQPVLVGTTTDIGDQKRSEEALRASETNLRQIVDSIPGLICTMSPTGEIEQLNRPLLEYLGKTPEELKGWKMTDAVHPDDLPQVIEAYTYSVTTGIPYAIEHRCRRADGIYRWFQVRALPVRGADGRIAGWCALLTDIDDRKRAEEALRIRELDLLQITETIPRCSGVLRPMEQLITAMAASLITPVLVLSES